MTRIEQLLNKNGESVFPVINESQIKHKANLQDMGNLSELKTEVKSSIVLAINENTQSIAQNLEQLNLKVTKSEVEKMISLIMTEVVTEDNLDDLLLASAVIISINDTLVELKKSKADVTNIPTKLSQLTNDKGFITKVQLAEIDLIQKIQSDIVDIYEGMEGMATKEDISALQAIIPTKVSDLDNDSSFIKRESEEYVELQKNVSSMMTQIANMATKDDLESIKNSIPTTTSQLENTSGFITIEDVPTGSLQQIEDDIESLKLTKAEQNFVESEIKRLDELIDAIEIPEGTDVRPIMKAIEELKKGKADKSEIPQKVSQLENDLQFIAKTDLSSHEQIVDILSSLSELGEGIKKVETSLIQVEGDVLNHKEDIGSLKMSESQLQADVGTLDTSVKSHGVKIAGLESNQREITANILKNKENIQANKDSILSIQNEVANIPKKTSDIINDSGFVNKSDILDMDLRENQTIKGLETKKANKEDIPTSVTQMDGVDTLQTKEDAKQEHIDIHRAISSKADRAEIPSKISEMEDDVNIATQSDISLLDDRVKINKSDIQDIQKLKRVFVSSQKISIENREEGNLYLQFGDSLSTIEDHMGNKKYLETNKVMKTDKHPTNPTDGTIYVLTTNQKGYITLGGTPKSLALLEDVEQKDKAIMDIITAMQEDTASVSDRVDINTNNIVEANEKIQQIGSKVGKVEANIEKHEVVLDGQGRDIVALREKDNTHDSQISSLGIKKANKEDIPSKLGQLENDRGFITEKDISHINIEEIQSQINSKADSIHTHKNSDIIGLNESIQSMWTAINGKAFTSHTHMPEDIYINRSGDKLSEISAKHIDYDGWNTVEDELKSLQGQISEIDVPSVDGIKKDIAVLQQEKADKTEIPTKLSQLEQDIDMGGEFVIPRKGEDFKEGEIHVIEVEEPLFSVRVDKTSENVTHNDGRFVVKKSDNYTDIDMTIASGEGELTLYFEDVSGYFSYTIYHINGDRHDSGWLGEEGDFKHSIKEGDRIFISTGDPMVCGYRKPPVTLKKDVMFEGNPISPKFDDSEILSDIKNVKDEIKSKADKSSIPKKVSELENDSGFITKSDLPPLDSFSKYTQVEEPINMNTGDEWHRIIQ